MTKVKNKKKRSFFKLILILFILCGIVFIYFYFNKNNKVNEITLVDKYLASTNEMVVLLDSEYNEAIKISRGTLISDYEEQIELEDMVLTKIKYDNMDYYVNVQSLSQTLDDVVKEKEMYVRTSATIYEDATSSKILSLVKKGEKVEIIGFNKIDENGVVDRYKIKYNDVVGYVYEKYLVSDYESSILVYDQDGIQEYMDNMGNSLGGGTATNLDYYPYEKPHFTDNEMPSTVRALYLNSAAVKSIDSYIQFALENNINAFVIDIKDNTSPAYDSPVMKEYSPTNAEHALNSYEDYKTYIKKAKDAGLYLIGRITTFKDSYFVEDHNEVAIKNTSTNSPFSHNGSYWPSAYNRYVWQFNVELGKEAITDVGFNEIQFDYVRFPDRTGSLEKNGTIDLNNVYNEEKAQALQNFVMYACDEIHSVGGYVSVDVFGESASNYVTAYGQFWAAISNVVDVISAMPYPDHFNAHEYGISEVVWTVPYKLLDAWSKYVVSKQQIIPTPAVVRTWIQTYNTTKTPSVIYDADKIKEQIDALNDNGLTGGYMTWNSGSNLNKYKEVSSAFRS